MKDTKIELYTDPRAGNGDRGFEIPVAWGCKYNHNGYFLVLSNLDLHKKKGMVYSAYGCRESAFFRHPKSGHGQGYLQYFGFVGGRVGPKGVAAAISEVEKRLGWKERSIFHTTTNPDAVVIEHAPYWMETPMKASLFTAFIRLGGRYWDGNLDTSMEKYEYFRDYPNATYRFLAGFTKINRRLGEGWVEEVGALCEYEPDRMGKLLTK
jgi:hypothetical protein